MFHSRNTNCIFEKKKKEKTRIKDGKRQPLCTLLLLLLFTWFVRLHTIQVKVLHEASEEEQRSFAQLCEVTFSDVLFFFCKAYSFFFFISPLSPCFYSLSSLSSRRSIRHTLSFSAEEEERKKTEKKKKRKEYSSESASERKENTAGFDSQRKRCACLPLGELSMRVRSQCA